MPGAQAQRRKPDLTARERTLSFGFQVNSQGLGMEVAHFRSISRNRKWMAGGIISLTSLVDLRENRIVSAYASQQGRPYFFDKVNWVYLLDFTFGVQRQIFKRTDHSRLSIHVGALAGPSLVILRPYVLNIAVPIPGTNQAFLRGEQYDPARHTFFDIYGEGDFFSGFNALKATGGFKAQAYAMLNVADRIFFIKAVRIGVTVHAFGSPLPVFATLPNRQVFVQGSLALMIGGGWNKNEKARLQEDTPLDEPGPDPIY